MDSLLPLYDGGNGDLAFEELAQDHRANEIVKIMSILKPGSD